MTQKSKTILCKEYRLKVHLSQIIGGPRVILYDGSYHNTTL